jgi:hypothetical protein
LIESKVSAICCSLLEEDGESREGGKVTMATAFETISILFSNLMNESMSDSFSEYSHRGEQKDWIAMRPIDAMLLLFLWETIHRFLRKKGQST